jgi:hypothetical protein
MIYLLFCLLPFSVAARANTIINFSFVSDDLQHRATGSLVTIDNGNGSFTAISGSGLFDNLPITLIPNVNAPNTAYSPTGYFYYDDLVLPNQNPLVTNPGLLFSINDHGATELNIFSEGPSYIAYLNNGFNDSGSVGGTPIPEPTTLPLVIAGISGVGLFWRLRPKRS